MKLRTSIFAAAVLAVAAPAAMADLAIPWLSYRTGPYSPGGIPVADGFEDYLTLLNERDGGIGGETIRVVQCETGYNTQKGVECYESTKGEGSLVYSPLSTGITYQLIPRATADGIPVHSMGYGRTAAADGTIFSHVFNFPAHYWDGASIAVNHILDLNGGDISGKKIGLVYHNSAYGKEPIRTLQELSGKHGYEVMLVPVDHPGQEQKAQWLQIRRESPDYLLMWGWGVMNSVAITEAANIRFPMENFIGIWWSGSENDVLPVGERAHGYKALALHGVGADFPVMADMQTHVLDTGLAAGDGDQVGTVLYMRGLYGAMLITEAIRVAQEMHGVSDITPEMMRDGLENLVITEELMAERGLPGFGPSFAVSCENHGGPGIGWVQQWDAEAGEWSIVSDAIQSDKSVIDALIKEDSAAYAAENNIEPRCG
ncbi:MAG: ABC transporter substrate-binding protein [Rhodobacteraceae bacterium]|nr:ABC transporter substrate-binding protein [Paracoccaceae bacterium]